MLHIFGEYNSLNIQIQVYLMYCSKDRDKSMILDVKDHKNNKI